MREQLVMGKLIRGSGLTELPGQANSSWSALRSGKRKLSQRTHQSNRPIAKAGDHTGEEEAEIVTVFLYMHGNAFSRGQGHRTDLYKMLRELYPSCYVATFDYRGYADSEGTPTEEGVIQDGLAMFEWVVTYLSRHHSMSSHERSSTAPSCHVQVILWGHSLGTAVSSAVAEKVSGQPHLRKHLGGLVLEAPFSDIVSASIGYSYFKHIFKNFLGEQYSTTIAQYALHPHLQFHTKNRIRDIMCPVLICHGERDSEIHCSHSEILFDHLRGDDDLEGRWDRDDVNHGESTLEVGRSRRGFPVYMLTMANGSHNNLCTFPILYTYLSHFLLECDDYLPASTADHDPI
tara:strand:- start:70 stop:1107 length:1038 start_codon:yes stop_codon:yes gene_type:complete